MLQSFVGLFLLVGIAWLCSENRRAVNLRVIASGLVLQFVLGASLLKVPALRDAFLQLNKAVEAVEAATKAGTSFIFGYLGGAPLPFTESYAGASYIFATRALPIILVTSAIAAVLFHWKVIPVIVRGFSFVLQRTMGIGGALGVAAAANIFAGMVEAPLFVRPYVAKLTRSELFAVMTCGMATIAGTMLVVYASVLGPVIPNSFGHILIASFISAPAALMISGVIVPETAAPTLGKVSPSVETTSTIDALVKGTMAGISLLANVIALIIVLVAVVSLVNQTLGLLPDVGGEVLTLQRLFGVILAPLVWLAGIPWAEAHTAGSLMGTKIVLNEFIAYMDLAGLPEGSLDERSRVIMTYAMCGFANFGSLGIMIGGLSAIAPDRRDEIVGLGVKSIFSGVLATLMTGAVVGVLY